MSIILSRQSNPADLVRFDTFQNLRTNAPQSVTPYPVESGPDVSNHIQPHALTVTFTGRIGIPGYPVPSVGAERVATFLERSRGQLLILHTPEGIYRNMALLDSPSTYMADGGRWDLVLQQLRVAVPEVTPIPPSQPVASVASEHASPTDKGIQSATTLNPNNPDPSKRPPTSFLATIFGGG